jgi:hypothetical protein
MKRICISYMGNKILYIILKWKPLVMRSLGLPTVREDSIKMGYTCREMASEDGMWTMPRVGLWH